MAPGRPADQYRDAGMGQPFDGGGELLRRRRQPLRRYPMQRAQGGDHVGALETVVEGITGLFFDEQTPESLIDAVEKYETETAEFEPEVIARHAGAFDRSVFKRRMRETIDRLLEERLISVD